MSQSTHTITLTARDGTKQVFDAIARGATADAQALQRLGREGSAALKQVDQAAAQTGRSMEGLKANAAAIGAGLGALTAAASLSGRAFVSQENQIRALDRAYGASAASMREFAERIQDSTNFSNDAARQSEIIAGSLARNYGLTGEQIQQLIARTADLATVSFDASGKQFGLVDAVQRVAGAVRGEGEAAEQLNLNLSDSAVAARAAAAGLTGWNTTMTESEKAAFRFQLFLEDSTYALGAAGEAAETTSGQMRHLVNEGQDLIQSFGGALGPISQTASVLGNFALIAPAAGAGIGKLVAGVGSLVGILGPVGLALAAGAAAVAIIELADSHGIEAEGARAAEAATADLVATLGRLNAAGNPLGGVAGAQKQIIDAMLAGLPAEIARLQAARDALTAPFEGNANLLPPDIRAQFDDLMNQVQALQGVTIDSSAVWMAFNSILSDTGTGAETAQQALASAFAEFGKTHDVTQFLATLLDINAHLGDYDVQANAAAEANRQLALSAAGAVDAFSVLDKAVADLTLSFDGTAKGQKILSDLQLIATQGTQEQRDAIQRLWQEAQTSEQAFTTWTNTVALNANIIRDQTAATDLATAAVLRYVGALGDALTAQMNERGAIEAILRVQRERILINAGNDAVQQRGVEMTERETLALLAQANATQQLNRQTVAQFKSMQAQVSEREALLALIEEQDRRNKSTGFVDLPDTTPFRDLFGTVGTGVGAVRDLAAALAETETNLDRVARGSSSAAVQFAAFKEVQDGIVASQGQFTGQLSEYNTQLGYLENAEELLNQRRAEGVALTKEQEDFLLRVDAAQERLTGGTEDATIALGMQALQYAENMRIGDEMNRNLDGVNRTTGELTDAIRDLISQLQGIPPDVTVAFHTDGLAGMIGEATTLSNVLDKLDGREVSAIVNILSGNQSGLADLANAGLLGHGGMVGAAGGRLVRTNEGGRETATLPTGDDVWLPTGTMVWPHAASVEGARRKGNSGAPSFTNCSFVIQANNPQQFYRQLQSARITEGRR